MAENRPVTDRSIDRRTFLQRIGGGLFAISLTPILGCEFNSVEPITTGRPLSLLTPIEAFYTKNGAEISIADWRMPVISRESWGLEVTGLVDRPQTFRFADLAARDDQEIDLLKTMRCVIDSNEVRGLIGTAVWTGVPLRLFLDEAGIDLASAKRLRLFGADRFTNNLPVDRIYGVNEPDLVEPLLVTRINGRPLPARHGAPVRLIVHEGFGYRNVKWITKVEVSASDEPFGTYQDAGFVDDGVMRLASRTTDPLQNVRLPAGPVRISGFAVSGSAGIAAVEVSLDSGPWQSADLLSREQALASDRLVADSLQGRSPDAYPFPWRGVWRTWEIDLDVPPGPHSVRVRAIDATGALQPETDQNGLADGVNGYAHLSFEAT